MENKFDFKGWVTRHDVKCSDGRTIKESAFKDMDKKKVPLVYMHNHTDMENVLGHAILEHRKEGVYGYGKFNDSAAGIAAKAAIKNGDLTSLSIWANKLKESNGDVIHGIIREVSLVLAGANPGAYIENVLVHSEDGDKVDGIKVFNGSDIELVHSEDDPADPKNPADPENPANLQHEDKTVEEVWKTLNPQQELMVQALIGAALEEAEELKTQIEQYKKKEEENNMKHNLFFNKKGEDGKPTEQEFLSHDEFSQVLADARKDGSVRDAFIAHGITDIDVLLPEVQSLNRTPELIARDQDWVSKVMAGVSKSPFARVKSTAANITADAARAKGYIKGNQKVEEVISALKRTTTPTTVYKFQKMDRDDVIDITDFDVIVFLKAEMRTMLNEELARAFLIGDGRLSSDDDKINPQNIRPIYGDDPVYTVSRVLTPSAGATAAAKAKLLIQDIVRARKLYKGSGNPSFYTTEDQLVEMLLLEDTNGRVIYDSVDKLHTALRVKEIVTVPVMEGINRVVGADQFDLVGILVNLTDYNVGADKGGAINFFEDFDLNFNKHEYLIETRCSGALKKPYSAIVFESKGSVVAG